MDKKELSKIIEGCGVNLYDIELVNENGENIYRITITHPDGISLDKCTEVTKILSPLIDREPPVSVEYRLEVSSPGIERKLTKLEHFKNSIGELVKLKLTINKYEKLSGKILSVDGEEIKIETDEGQKREINFNDIQKAKTYFQWQ